MNSFYVVEKVTFLLILTVIQLKSLILKKERTPQTHPFWYRSSIDITLRVGFGSSDNIQDGV